MRQTDRQPTAYTGAAPDPAAAAPGPCRFCDQTDGLDAALQAHVARHVAELDTSLKVDQATHCARLAICRACAAHSHGLCGYCGCFVLIRTVRKNRACPHPDGAKWPSHPDGWKARTAL